MLKARLNILVALPAEAKPINQLLGLQRRQPDGELPLYVAQDIALVLCGPGMQAAAAGVHYLHQVNAKRDPHWVNIGIAGHGVLPVGQGILASEVVTPSGQTWQMPVTESLPCLSCPVHTIARATDDYPDPVAYDMEAAGFVSAALDLTPIDKLRCVKIISDNPVHPSQGINAKMVRSLIHNQAGLIKQLIERILRGHG
ncbi:MAG: hypothetical protein QNJ78_13265 [Gammaproteobacteria bacterium]|nr:hypothetical protein [Gammaproteobacteria bacterium]